MKPKAPAGIGPMFAVLAVLCSWPAAAATYTVTGTADTGSAGTLRWAIDQANASVGADTISFANNLGVITLSAALPIISDTVTIDGGTGNSLDGNDSYRIFFVDAPGAAVSISNLSLANGHARGGDGGVSGGGGLGAGGAIFVNSGAVTVSNISLSENSAQGGQGGNGALRLADVASGGGGGLGGDGGDGSSRGGGGGGGYQGQGGTTTSTQAQSGAGGGGGIFGNGGDTGTGLGGGGGGGTTNGGVITPGTGGGSGGSVYVYQSAGQDGSAGGGGGGAGYFGNGGNGGTYGGGGGAGVDGNHLGGAQGGNGGDFGGGGGAAGLTSGVGGTGGFGGGGGGGGTYESSSALAVAGGAGGFGGGGGGSARYNGGGAGAYAGKGGTYNSFYPGGQVPGSAGGGGGAALGGAIFVRSENGASIQFLSTTEVGSSVQGGTAGTSFAGNPYAVLSAATNGQGVGSAIFLPAGFTIFQSGTVNGSIAGLSGAGIQKSGDGTLVLMGANSYDGGTQLAGGALVVGSGQALGTTGTIFFTGGTLQFSAANTTDYSSRFSTGSDQLYRLDTGGQNVSLATALTSPGGSLTKLGEGTLTLTADSTFVGTTVIRAGTLQIGDGGTTGSLNSHIEIEGGNLVFNRSDALTYEKSISSLGGLTKMGSGTLTLKGGQFYHGSTTVSAGTLRLESKLYGNGTLPGLVTVQSGATLDLQVQDVFGNHTANSAARLVIESGGLVTNGNVFNTFTDLTLNGGELRAGGGSSSIFTAYQLSGTVAVGGASASSITSTGAANSEIQLGNNTVGGFTTFHVADVTNSSAADLIISADLRNGLDPVAVSVASGLAKTGTGLLTLSGHNTYTGSTSVATGTLRLEGVSASPAFSIAAGAMLELAPAADYTSSVTFSGSGTLRKSGVVSARWTGASATFALDSGSLIDVQGGTFVGGTNGNEIWTNNKSDLHVADGAIFNGVEANVRVDALSGSGIIRSGFDGAGYQGLTFGVDNGSGTFAGELADNPGSGVGAHYIKAGTGTQTLTGSNTSTGVTTISGGTLRLSGAGRLSDTTAVTVASGGRFDLNGISDAIGSLAGAGTATLGSGTLTVGGNGTSTAFTGTLSGSGGLVKAGSGTLALTGNTAYSGATSIQAGTLRLEGGFASPGFVIGANAALELAPAANYATSVTFSGSGILRKSGAVSARWEGAAATFALDSGSLIDVQGGTFVGGAGGNEVWTSNQSDLHVAAGAIFNGVEANVRVDALTGSGIIRSGYNGADYQGFTFGVDNGSGTFDGELADNPGAGVGARYVKVGTGTQTLAGNNTHSGGTTITNGALIAGHDQAVGTGVVMVDGGVFLVETGVTITNEIVLSGGSYLRSLGAGADLSDAINATSFFTTERPDTTAEILQGTLSAQGILESSFQEHSSAFNDAIRLSDVYSLHGTGTNVFVLQLSMTGLTADSYLGWLDTDSGSATSNQWINAVEGNSGGTATFFARGYHAATDFHLGYYGVDVVAGTVWAVLDHNSHFSIVPEPGIVTLLGLAVGLLLARRQRTTRRPKTQGAGRFVKIEAIAV